MTTPGSWWRARREALLALCPPGGARFVYDLPTIRHRARSLLGALTSLERLYFSMKANHHPDVLRALAAEGLGMECVSAPEVQRARAILGPGGPILFTPNFCPVDEYRAALAAGAEVTIDGPEVLAQAPSIFAGREIGLRLDPGGGAGHHEKVITAGRHQKFGHPIDALDPLLAACDALRVSVTGLHAHVGSGILEPGAWARTGRALAAVRDRLPALRWVDLGGGLGVPERPRQRPLDLGAVERSLADLQRALPGVGLRMEPGRFLVSEAGALLAEVTQVRQKGALCFVGLATGMNSLIRPALYGAWHGIHNLTRLDQQPTETYQIVGPICETADVLGSDRALPETRPGDVLLIENCGAYGRVMSSSYNLREPADEVALE